MQFTGSERVRTASLRLDERRARVATGDPSGADNYRQRSRAERIAARTGTASAVAPSIAPRPNTSPIPSRASRLPFRSWRITAGPSAITGIGVIFSLLLAWGLAMAGIAFFGDRMTPQLVAQQNELQANYEQRVGALQAEIQRLQVELDAAVAATQTPSPEVQPERSPQESLVPQSPPPPRPASEARVVELARALTRVEARLAAINELTQSLQTSLPGTASTIGSSPSGPVSAPGAGVPAPRVPSSTPTAAASSRDRRSVGRSSAPPEIPDDPAIGAAKPHDGVETGPIQFWRSGQKPPDRRSELPESTSPLSILPSASPSAESAPQVLPALERRLAAADGALVAQAAGLAAALRTRTESVRAVLADLEVEGGSVSVKSPPRALATLAMSERGTPFGLGLEEARLRLAELVALRPLLSTVPFARPVPAGVRTSSRFGPRSDPFLGTARLHSGLDFAGPTGTPVIATGAGVVLSAGWGGGYGNLIQVDHGNGVVTRYAHLSEIKAAPGQPVSRGQIIGLVGSTGRSTGPHLHYETRMSGEAADPMDFMDAGALLGLVR
jgi:murein DD-endopeptidase MepM/ murein hydrolase activator NlpD